MTGDYEVGYRRPPVHTRFRKGRSGNPKGRPKGAHDLKTDLAEELGERIAIREGDRRVVLSKQRAFIKRIAMQAIKGDVRSAALLARLVILLLGDGEDASSGGDLDEADREILARYEGRLLSEAIRKAGSDEGTMRRKAKRKPAKSG